MADHSTTDDTTPQLSERARRRRAVRETFAAKVDGLRTWRAERYLAAEKRRDEAREQREGRELTRAEARAAELLEEHVARQPVPRGNERPVKPSPASEVGTYRGFVGNHAERRAVGQRGRRRRPRTRELPGAEARRLEGARREWGA